MAKKPSEPTGGKPAKKPTGRPSTYSEALVEEILTRVSHGEPLAAVCRDLDIAHTTWYRWVDDHGLSDRIARARRAGHDVIAADALRIADTPQLGEVVEVSEDGKKVRTEDMLGHRKLQVETRLKLLAKWDPRYSEKLALGGAEDLPPIKQDVTLEPGEAYKRLLEGK